MRDELLRFSREIAFAAARVYAGGRESRAPGTPGWRLWSSTGWSAASTAASRSEPARRVGLALHRPGDRGGGFGARRRQRRCDGRVHRTARRGHLDALAGRARRPTGRRPRRHRRPAGRRAGCCCRCSLTARLWPGLAAEDISAASRVTRAALSGLRAVPAWPGAPRPVSADALLPERALAGDPDARDELVDNVYRPLVEAGDVLLDTVSTFLDSRRRAGGDRPDAVRACQHRALPAATGRRDLRGGADRSARRLRHSAGTRPRPPRRRP